jgi:peptidoglycan/xylan/chitin deacetylase (PgdA/CDA1 family)
MKKREIGLIGVILFILFFTLYMNQVYGWFVMSEGDFDQTYVSLRFDDGWKSQMNAYYSLKQNNLSGSLYIISDFVGKEGYMDWNDIGKASEIMEIGGHTRTHADLNIITDYESEISYNYESLKEKGFNPISFVYPYGNYNKNSVEFVKKYYFCASTQDIGVNTRKSDKYLLKDFTLRKGNDLNDVKRIIKNNSWVILTFHDVGEPAISAPSAVRNNAVSVSFFDSILKYLKENKIKVITIKEGCSLLGDLNE